MAFDETIPRITREGINVAFGTRTKFADAKPPQWPSPHDVTGIHLGIQIATEHRPRIDVVQFDGLALGVF